MSEKVFEYELEKKRAEGSKRLAAFKKAQGWKDGGKNIWFHLHL